MNLRQSLEDAAVEIAGMVSPQDEIYRKGLGTLLSNAADTAEAIAFKILMEKKDETAGKT